ncbi:MAG TPA: nitrite reductase small subunit NirD [Burkholderiaceae bacterium]|nr:nitrite reductase small subunit NirD [Burkholderiaceae bacterium]
MSTVISSCNWVSVCHVDEVPIQGSRVVQHRSAPDIAVFKAVDGHVFALVDRCPHRGGPLSSGLIHGHSVTCPLHSWNIDLESGQALAPDEGCARKVPVKIEDGMVHLDLGGL